MALAPKAGSLFIGAFPLSSLWTVTGGEKFCEKGKNKLDLTLNNIRVSGAERAIQSTGTSFRESPSDFLPLKFSENGRSREWKVFPTGN